MKRQSTSWFCGIASIANALEVLGIKRSQREIARLCDVRASTGTDETEMKRALLANRVAVDEYSSQPTDDPYVSWAWAFDHVDQRGPAILCVSDDEHWVTAIGVCGFGRLVIFDPSRNQGVEVHTHDTLAKLWANADGVYYGLGVSRG